MSSRPPGSTSSSPSGAQPSHAWKYVAVAAGSIVLGAGAWYAWHRLVSRKNTRPWKAPARRHALVPMSGGPADVLGVFNECYAIRQERTGDFDAIDDVHLAAFSSQTNDSRQRKCSADYDDDANDSATDQEANTPEVECGAGEAQLVRAVRAHVGGFDTRLSLVAEDIETKLIVGHVLLSPMWIDLPSAASSVEVLAIAPVGVLPFYQRKGIGSALIEEVLHQARLVCKEKGIRPLVVCLGHPEYYPKFGFRPAAEFGIKCPFDLPDPRAYTVCELEQGAADGLQGGVGRYSAPFQDV